MLEEREEEIVELMDEVNKLQEQKLQSPEVVNTLKILKSKLKSSRVRKHNEDEVLVNDADDEAVENRKPPSQSRRMMSADQSITEHFLGLEPKQKQV